MVEIAATIFVVYICFVVAVSGIRGLLKAFSIDPLPPDVVPNRARWHKGPIGHFAYLKDDE